MSSFLNIPAKGILKNISIWKEKQAEEYLTQHTNHLKLRIHIPPKQTASRTMGSVSQEGNHA